MLLMNKITVNWINITHGDLYLVLSRILLNWEKKWKSAVRDKTGVTTENINTNTCNGNKKKENIKDNIGKLNDDTVGGLTKWKLELKGYKPVDTMVCNGNNYYYCPNHHDRGMWVSHKPD